MFVRIICHLAYCCETGKIQETPASTVVASEPRRVSSTHEERCSARKEYYF